MSAHDQLLVVIDPVARRIDGESVRIAKDVLCAGAAAKICLPEGPEEFSRALARKGSRRPVVVGDDRALQRTVSLLHQGRELADQTLAVVPVGAPGASLELARSLGVPTGAVAAARAVLDGVAHRLDLLVDDSDGVVLGDLSIPAAPACAAAAPASARTAAAAGGGPSVWDTCRSLVRTLVRPAAVPAPADGGRRAQRLRVEADGVVLSDLHDPVEDVRVRAGAGHAEVTVCRGAEGEPVLAQARAVTVSGTAFRYRADTQVTGPVRRRTWTLRPQGWSLVLPQAEA
ncbi:diacylglycerol kinase [Streptomyces sp. HNM0663]|uniref:Diacylglycerol kinase n=1 Tax=Streptomyces chengmaiensis TaxID=3040919 RepID=A0ABT6HIV0_9ACTN|nr:diacylglycerol kinase [Streptomyces chengmaiensis]MDH2387814.1 diacylglycerol kinase [Streptomyces chengmaiensis]